MTALRIAGVVLAAVGLACQILILLCVRELSRRLDAHARHLKAHDERMDMLTRIATLHNGHLQTLSLAARASSRALR